MPFSDRANAALAAESSEEVFLVLAEILHPDLGASNPLRLVNNTEDVISNGQTFIALPFTLDLPGDSENGPGAARIKVDNVDRRIVEALRTITSPPLLTLRVVLADEPDTIELELPALTLREATYDAAVVQGTLRFEDITLEPIAEEITPARFPGLL